MDYTVVALHAHPDDEALLTGGTLARAAAEGHRVVLVLATDGGAGLTSARLLGGDSLGRRRRAELTRAATALGVARVDWLGYDDSGSADAPTGAVHSFAGADVEAAAARVAQLLGDERADVLIGYDAAGGYGHPDHLAVHRVARRAAELASTPVLLEATVDREALLRGLRLVHRLPGLPQQFQPDRFRTSYTAHSQLTHRVDVRGFIEHKRRAMAAHVSQGTGDAGIRTLRLLLRLPRPIFRRVLGTEWFVQPGRPPHPVSDDIFASLRDGRR